MSVPAAQLGLTFAPRPARPVRRSSEHAVDGALKLALSLLLQARHCGLANAACWEDLRDELVAEGRPMCVVRRLQEAAEQLLDEGKPVIGLSSEGVCWAATAEEVERSLRESEKRARKSLRRRSRLRRVWMEMKGQQSIEAIE